MNEPQQVSKPTLPELRIEQLALGELGGETRTRVEESLGDNRTQKLAELEESNHQILRELPPVDTVAEIRRRAKEAGIGVGSSTRRKKRAPRWVWLAMPTVSAVAFVLWTQPDLDRASVDVPAIGQEMTSPVVTSPESEIATDEQKSDSQSALVAVGTGEFKKVPTKPQQRPAVTETARVDSSPKVAGGAASKPTTAAKPARLQFEKTRSKGVKPHLVIARRRGEAVEPLRAGDVVGEGDLLQISYIAMGSDIGTVFSIDGFGVVTLHYPAAASGDVHLKPDRATPLDHSYELDAAPNFERFFFVTQASMKDGAWSVDSILDAAESLGSKPSKVKRGKLKLPAHLNQWSVLLKKAGR